MGYRPIRPIEAPGLIDIPLWTANTPFSVLPTLSFLKERYEVVTASSTYYDPLRPLDSRAAPVIYNETLVITTLSEQPIKLRHNGSSVDMELYVDTYTKIKKDKEMGPFDAEKRISEMREGDRFERYSTAYVYANIGVPHRSDRIWDGRGNLCVDAQGNEVDARDRRPIIQGEVRAILEDASLTPYTVFSLGGQAHTTKEPSAGMYRNKYDVEMRNFLESNYTSDGIEEKTSGVITKSRQIGTGRSVVANRQQSYVVALLDGHYFVKWVTLVINDTEYGEID